MKKINTTYWKEYIIENLFDKLDLRFKPKKFVKTKHVSIERTEEFNIPLVNAKHSNNGIMYYGRESDFESEEMTIDIVADGAASTGDVYPQPQRTGVLYNAYLIKLKNRKSSKAVLCFLSTVIERCVKQKFGYDNKCTWDKVKKEKILLPATPAGEPDWRYMEDYMRRIEQRTQTAISAFVSSKYSSRKIDTTYWKEFALNSLFDIVLSKGDIQAKRMREGGIPLVSSGKFNNGICAYIADGDGKAEIFNADVITTDMFGKSYYQDKPFYAVSHGRVNMLLPYFKMNHYIAEFIVSVLDASFLTRYSFSGMCSQSQLKKEKILLPSTSAGEPDWRYMEMYMRGVEAIAKEKISLLTRKNQESNNKTVVHYHINAENISLQTEGTINIGEINEK